MNPEITKAGHLQSKHPGAPVRINLRGLSTQSVLVTLRSLRWWRRAGRHVVGRVLDIGCGAQPYRLLFRRKAALWVGLDVAQPRAVGYPIDLRASAQDLPFEDETFDTIIAAEIIEHLPQPDRFWSEAARVLRPGGRILVSTPFLYWIHEEPNDFQRLTRFGIARALESVSLDLLHLAPKGGVLTAMADLACKTLYAALSLPEKILAPRSNSMPPRPWLREGIIGRAILAWPQVALHALIKNERLLAHKITSGYLLIARKPEAKE